MEKKLEGKKIAILIDEGVEQVEFTSPLVVLRDAGAEVGVVAKEKKVKASDEERDSVEFNSDVNLNKASPELFDALFLPGGAVEVENLRMNPTAIDFVKHFIEMNKPIAAISYGQWILIEADGVKDKKITSDPAIKADFIDAGAKWQDEEVVEDGNILTCQSMNSNLASFNDKMIELFSKSDDLIIKGLNSEENKDKKLNMHPTDPIGENPTKKWGISELS